MKVGSEDGADVNIVVGTREGKTDGAGVGSPGVIVGWDVLTKDGIAVGLTVGFALGIVVGAMVGRTVGIIVGKNVGESGGTLG